jgi:hypothetical protein
VSLSSEETCVRGQGGAVRGFDDRRRVGADEEMAGSLNVCHRQRGRVVGGQWLAVEGGRYHVLAATTWSGRGV